MRVIPPITLTDALVTSSTAPETATSAYIATASYANAAHVYTGTAGGALTDYKSLTAANIGHTPSASPTFWQNMGTIYTTWVSGSTYALADIVSVVSADSHHLYEALQGTNTGHLPSGTDAWWQDLGPTNKQAMFDLLRNTATVQPAAITVVLTPGQRVNSIAILGMVGNSLTVSATSVQGGGSVFNVTTNLDTRAVVDWYDYFFAPFSTEASYISFDIPPYSDIIITVALTATSGNAEIGSCVLGTYVDIGDTQYNAVSDVLNFSTIARDSFGNSLLTQRRNVPKTNQTIWCKKTWVDKILLLRDTLNATPAVWSGLNANDAGYFNALLILGIYKQFSINMQFPDYAVITLELEEV